ncbi:MAG: type 1 glutamine amidotransferase domain-containing protein [Pseudomonadota bacterium]
MAQLNGLNIAILATDGFEESELFSPKEAVEREGAVVDVISIKDGDITGWKNMEPGRSIKVDKVVSDVKISDYDGLIIPGGLYNPDALRRDESVLSFTRDAFAEKLPVGAICHGPQVLISAELVEDRTMTGYDAIWKDLENAGAIVKDEAVVVDAGLVTSRTPDDLDAFNAKLIEEFAEGKHARQKRSLAA